MSDFDRCVTLTRDRMANYVFTCKKGFWSVSAHSCPKARREAEHYFQQYKSDGEYHEIIGGDTQSDVLKKHL